MEKQIFSCMLSVYTFENLVNGENNVIGDRSIKHLDSYKESDSKKMKKKSITLQ